MKRAAMIKRLWHWIRHYRGPELLHWDAMGLANGVRGYRCPKCGLLLVHRCGMVCVEMCPQCDRID